MVECNWVHLRRVLRALGRRREEWGHGCGCVLLLGMGWDGMGRYVWRKLVW